MTYEYVIVTPKDLFGENWHYQKPHWRIIGDTVRDKASELYKQGKRLHMRFEPSDLDDNELPKGSREFLACAHYADAVDDRGRVVKILKNRDGPVGSMGPSGIKNGEDWIMSTRSQKALDETAKSTSDPALEIAIEALRNIISMRDGNLSREQALETAIYFAVSALEKIDLTRDKTTKSPEPPSDIEVVSTLLHKIGAHGGETANIRGRYIDANTKRNLTFVFTREGQLLRLEVGEDQDEDY